MAKHIGTLILNIGAVAIDRDATPTLRAVASQGGHTVAIADDVKALVKVLQDMGLTGTLKRGDGPLMVHDCRCCTFLGHAAGADHYCCRGSLIARTGDDGPDYHSMPAKFLVGMTFPAGDAVGAGVALYKKAGCPGLR